MKRREGSYYISQKPSRLIITHKDMFFFTNKSTPISKKYYPY